MRLAKYCCCRRPRSEATDLFDSVLENCNNLRRRAQKAERENTLLKEKLITERYWRLFSHLKDGMEQAREQLRGELPEVFE